MNERPDLLRDVSSFIYDALDEHGEATAGTIRQYVKNNHGDNAAGHSGHILDRMVRRGAVAYDNPTGRYALRRRIPFGGKT